jgi:acetylornithine deacetylase
VAALTPDALFARITAPDVLDLAQKLIRTPSSSMKEGPLADLLAAYMTDLGMAVEIMEVSHPHDPGRKTRQPVGRLKGTGGGKTLMFNGHMDPGVEMSGWSVDPHGGHFEDGWLWGMGAHDDKGGLAAALVGLKALIETKVPLSGDVLMCPVAAHKLIGAGTRALIKAGVKADYCINIEHCASTIATTAVGIVFVRVRTSSPELFFRHSAKAKANYFNPVEQQMEIIRRLGRSFEQVPPGGWMTYTPHPDLPGFPTLSIDTIHREHYLYLGQSGKSVRECDLTFQVRTVPGQTTETIRKDLEQLFVGIKKDHPAFNASIIIPADGPDAHGMDPMFVEKDHPMVAALKEGHEAASGAPAMLGAGLRIGNVGDGNLMCAAGVPSLQYGPGDIRIYAEWPAPDERVRLDELVVNAKAMAWAAYRLCA